MKEKSIILGCDISKDKIDIAEIDQTTKEILFEKEYSNNIKGYKNIIKKYGSLTNNLHIVMEATGNYHIRFITFLEESSILFSIVNPLSVKRFAQMKMIRLKTDKVDAKTIALYAVEQNPAAFKPISKAQKKIKSIRTVLNSLIKQRTMNKNLLHSQKLLGLSENDSIKSIKVLIKTLNKRIKILEKQIEILIKKHFFDTYKQLLSVKGIGPKTASGIISYLGDLSNFENHKKIASFIGITPAIKESGKSLKKYSGITKQGNSSLRTLFYLAALSASRHNYACKILYDRLLAKGKRKKTALIAVANKLIKQLFAIVKYNRTFINNYSLKLDF